MGEERERKRDSLAAEKCHCCCIFQMIAWPVFLPQWRIIVRKQIPDNVICLFCSRMCCTLSSISCHNPSIHPSIHSFVRSSIRLSVCQFVILCVCLLCCWPQLQCINVSCHARIFARSLCCCKEFNMCFDYTFFLFLFSPLSCRMSLYTLHVAKCDHNAFIFHL